MLALFGVGTVSKMCFVIPVALALVIPILWYNVNKMEERHSAKG